MRNLAIAFGLALALPFTACTVGKDSDPNGVTDDGSTDDGTSDGGTTDGGTPIDTGISGNITAPTTWSGNVLISAGTTIAAGVTVTVDPGTTIEFKPAGNLTVNGTLDVQGTAAAKVTLKPAGTGAGFGGVTVNMGGTVHMKYAIQTGGALHTNGATATITLEDTKLFKTSGDFLILNGGSVTATYSQIGKSADDVADTTHCQLHFNEATAISITHSNINGAPYGLMFYGGTGAVFTNNNWFGNGTNVSTQPGVSGDFSGSYFQGAAPVSANGATITYNTPATAMLTDAGVRP